MVRKILMILLAAAVSLPLCACSGSGNESSENSGTGVSAESSEDPSVTVHEVSGSGVSYLVEDASAPSASSSSVSSPLGKEEWGTAAKFCLKDNGYVNVPVRIVSVRRGSGVNAEVKKIMNASSFNYYFEPSEKEEYAIAEYEICLDGFPVGEGGITCDVTAFVTGTDGQAIKLSDGSYWSATASSLDNETYYYEGTVRSMLAYRIPKECSGYMITLGEYGETQAFVKPE